MLFRLVTVRRNGQKRSREELAADPGHTVRITINRQTDGIGAAAHRLDCPMSTPWRLSDVRIVSLSGDFMVLAGMEPVGACWENRYERQTWWLDLLGPEAFDPGFPRQRGLTVSETKTDDVSSKGGISTPIGEK